MSQVAVLAGDGIGPEITAAAQRVLATILPELTFVPAAVGAAAIAAHGTPLPDETLTICAASKAILQTAAQTCRRSAIRPLVSRGSASAWPTTPGSR